MTNAQIRQIAQDQGWDDSALLDFALDYLAERGDVDGFGDFLTDEAQMENARSSGTARLKKPARPQYPDTVHDSVLPLPLTDAHGRRKK